MIFFDDIDKKINQISVCDADREMPTLGSTDYAENSVNLVSCIIPLPSGRDFLSAVGTDDRFYLCPPVCGLLALWSSV